MSTLVVEYRFGRLWLVRYASPSQTRAELLAQFESPEAAEVYKSETAQAMLFAREVGRSGLG